MREVNFIYASRKIFSPVLGSLKEVQKISSTQVKNLADFNPERKEGGKEKHYGYDQEGFPEDFGGHGSGQRLEYLTSAECS
jgi:hypothetical protein